MEDNSASIDGLFRKEVDKIAEILEKKRKITISSIEDSAKPILIAKLLQSFEDTPSKFNRAVFWFVKNEKEAQTIQNIIRVFSKKLNFPINSKYFFPQDEDSISWENKININTTLFEIIRHKLDLIIIPIEAIYQSLPPLSEFSKNIISFDREEKAFNIPLDDIVKKISDIGYQREIFASAPGYFTIKGDILDIFPINHKDPVRIEFFGNRIEKIYTINQKNKKKISDIKSIEILPIKLSNKLHSNLSDYLAYSTLSNNECIFIINEPTELKNELEFIEPVLWKKLNKIARKNKIINFEIISSDPFNSLDFKIKKAPIFYYELNNFREYILRLVKQNWTIVFATKDKDKIKALLKFHTPLINYLENKIISDNISGFISENNNFILLTDTEIFGIPKTGKIKKDIKFISELKEGDYIVHYDHGVGKFVGMSKREIDEGVREFFILEYAKGDRLFLPVEYSEKITKYIGVAHPKIHRLHEASWSQVKEKIKKKAEKIAKELINIYAQRQTKKGFKFSEDNEEMKSLYQSFPFQETIDQTKVWQEVKDDMEKNKDKKPMDRLICGDVGFGKTEIAIRAAVKATQDKKQVAILCPTTILAQQHYDTIVNRLKNFNLKIDVLSRFKTSKQQLRTVEKITSGEIDIVVGTHRLLSQDIKFKDLGLLIIDEEQRFGVKHKERIKEFKSNVDVLTLTATPIPRTLNLSLSGLRDISTIETPPEGRRTVKTIIRRYDNDIVEKAIRKELDRQGQVYYLHNRVKTIQAAAKKIKIMFPGASVDIAHGQLAEGRLADVMHRFDKGQIDILVCSSIVENGLDLPNVNTLIVEKSTNFGLSSLYQLRGRIGRSHKKAYAYFLYQNIDLKEQAKKRLQALLEAKELGAGFKLALRDLEIRGVGNILGKEQSGNVTAIGLNLYTRILNKAVKELKEGIAEEEIDVSIDLPLSAYIPHDFITDDKKRIFTYQEIANIDNLDELNDYKNTLKKKFNIYKLPDELINLFHIIEIKIIGRNSRIENIDSKIITKPTGEKLQKIILTPFKNKVDYSKAKDLLKINPYWELYENNLKIEMDYLGNDWINNLKSSIKVLQ